MNEPMTATPQILPAGWALAGLLTARYGKLALTQAAGRAAEAERTGDREMAVIWSDVVISLRSKLHTQDSR